MANVNLKFMYYGLKREDFEQYTKEELVDILVKLSEVELETTDKWHPQPTFLNMDSVADIMRKRD